MEPILQTTQDERAQCLADMADTEYGTLKNYDVCFGFIRRLIVDAETAAILADDYAKQAAEIERLAGVVRKANDQAEHFERLWYLAKDDANRYAFAKTLEGQMVTMATFKMRGAAELDQAIDDVMAEDADARNQTQEV